MIATILDPQPTDEPSRNGETVLDARRPEPGRDITDARILAAMRLAEARLDTALTTSALARAVGLSQFHFVRLFQDQVGETVSHYIRRVRLDDAASRLRWTREAVVSIALSIGYGSQAAFTRAFSTRFGTTPADFRRSDSVRVAYPRDERSPGLVRVRRVEALSCIGRRYVGRHERPSDRWRHFLRHLPSDLHPRLGATLVRIGRDDPRITPPDQIREDCCVVVPPRMDIDPGCLRAGGLHALSTTASLYAGARHCAAYASIHATYGLIADRWFAEQSRYRYHGHPGTLEIFSPSDDPTSAEAVACEVLIPVA